MVTAPTDESLNWLGEFRNREVESTFRGENLDNLIRINIGIGLIISVGSILFGINDFHNYGLDPFLIATRSVQALLSLVCCWVSWSSRRWQFVYSASYVLAAAVTVATLIVDFSRPPDYLLHLGLDIVILMGIYIVVPGIFAQITLAGVFSVALILMHFIHKTPAHELANLAIVVAIVCANFVGILMSSLYNSTKRRFYAQIAIERSMRVALQKAETSLRQLKQLLPMCANCKKIRDDAGYWQQVEVYMQEISGQQITHSICPSCVHDLYGDELGKL